MTKEEYELLCRLKMRAQPASSSYRLDVAVIEALEATIAQRDRFVERFDLARVDLRRAEAERDRLAGEVDRLKYEVARLVSEDMDTLI